MITGSDWVTFNGVSVDWLWLVTRWRVGCSGGVKSRSRL